ncbi:MAG: T9SS C-terminal target domain-containing protein [Alphaproteobacteria bacterium]|nr:MAG: T9SS C-terminal target domain-containing protein [Alphaproteobacteria bacterium]
MKIPIFEIYTHFKILYIYSPYCAQLSIYNIYGRLVASNPINSGKSLMQLQDTGIYMVKLTGSDYSIIKKVFVE